MPEFLQQARGASALSSGLTTLPGAVGLWLNSQLAARAYQRIGPRRMAVAGLAGITVIFCLLGLITTTGTSTWLIRVLAFCSGSGIAWCNIAVQTSSFATISSADTGRASALFNTQTRVAGGLGVAVLVTIVSTSYHAGTMVAGGALVTAFHHAFLTAAGITVAAGLIALRIRDADAAATMRRPGRLPAASGPASHRTPATAPILPPEPGDAAEPT
jgi:MFS family permease